MIVATCGHVDHGKTLLVHSLTGIQTDRLEQEQVRGLTIDLGFAYADFGECRLGFVDVPGHIRFIDNMLAGVSVIDFGLLVIAADDGPMPQTREHLAIMELLQIRDGAVVLSKIDRVTDQRIAEVTGEIRKLLKGTPFEARPIFPVSSVSGAGIESLANALVEAAGNTRERGCQGYFRLAVDRAFTIKGAGLVVTGSVFSGRVAEGDELRLMPANIPVRVRALHRQDQPTQAAGAGDRVSLNITGPDLTKEMIHRGNWVTANPAAPTNRADALIRVLPTEKRSLRHWTPVHIHTAANHVTARIATLEASAIEPGASGLVQLVLSQPINLCHGDRLIVRDQGAEFTLGGGRIIAPVSPPRGRARPERLHQLRALTAEQEQDRLTGLLKHSPAGIDARGFQLAENLTDAEWRGLLASTPAAVIAGERVISADQFNVLSQSLVDALTTWQGQNSQAAGASRRQLTELAGKGLDDGLLDALIARLVADRKLSLQGNVFTLPGHTVRLAPQDEKIWQQLMPILKSDSTRPPVAHELAKQLGKTPTEIQKVLIQCMRAGLVVRPVTNRFFLPEGIESLRRLVDEIAAASPDGTFSVQDYRNASGIGRNLSIEILEYFDRSGITVRLGDKRKLRG